MKKQILSALLLVAMLSCEEEGLERVPGGRTATGCFLSAITASNLGTYGYIIEDGKVVGMSYDGVAGPYVYTYDDEGKLKKIELVTGVWKFFYNSSDRLVRQEMYDSDILKSKTEYTYTSDGTLEKRFSASNIDGDEQWFQEAFYEYERGNPIKQSTYFYTSVRPKGDASVVTMKYDSKENPYNTLGNITIPQENNVVEYRYEGDPLQDTDIIYTYNDDGFPVTYRQVAINRPDYADVTGTYEYVCAD